MDNSRVQRVVVERSLSLKLLKNASPCAPSAGLDKAPPQILTGALTWLTLQHSGREQRQASMPWVLEACQYITRSADGHSGCTHLYTPVGKLILGLLEDIQAVKPWIIHLENGIMKWICVCACMWDSFSLFWRIYVIFMNINCSTFSLRNLS